MKKFLSNLRTAVSDLVYGRPVPPQPKKVITVDIQKELTPNPQLESPTPNESPASLLAEALPVIKQNDQILPPKSLSSEKLVVLPFDDPQLLSHFAETNREVVYKYLLKRLKKAIHQNMDGVRIFQFNNPNKVAEINRDKYESQLDTMMRWFVETEDYESAGECRDLIRKITKKNVVDQSM
jgi:hypothetical protein